MYKIVIFLIAFVLIFSCNNATKNHHVIYPSDSPLERVNTKAIKNITI